MVARAAFAAAGTYHSRCFTFQSSMRLLAFFVSVLISVPALAKANGIGASSCTGCHGGNNIASLQATTANTMINPGQTVAVTVTIASGFSNGGVFVTAGGKGTLTPGPGMKTLSGGLSHSSPMSASGGTVTFTFNFTATNSPDGADIDVLAVGGNADNRSSGDKTGATRLSLVWGCSGIRYYADYDGDGHGNGAGGTTLRCSKPQGYAATNDDCDENDERVYPGATEACNGRDDNCNGQVDEGLNATTTWPDLDGDGYGDNRGASQSGCSSGKRAPNNTDCDDTDPLIHPGGTEVCNRKDDNCDGRIDDGVQARCGVGWCERLGPTCDSSLCSPGKPVTEICNALDDDCDGLVDEGALCPGGTCYEGACVDGDVPLPDSGTGGGAGGGTQSRDGGMMSPATQSCVAVPGSFSFVSVALLAVAARWRRSARGR